jgi:integrase
LRRARYQFGCLELRNNTWSYRFRETDTDGKRRKKRIHVGTLDQYRTESDALRAAEALRLKVNEEAALDHTITFGALVDRFIDDERLLDVIAQPPGVTRSSGLRYSTACSYLSVLNGHIKPRWATTPLSKMRPVIMHDWLRKHDVAPKTKAHIKALMHRLFERAMLWEMVPLQRNPMELVEVKGICRRLHKPVVLTPEQFYALADLVPEPYRIMVMTAQCLGLRVSEILVLKWSDFDFGTSSVMVTRASVHGRVEKVKTEYSEDELPLDEGFARLLDDWRSRCPKAEDDWVFPSHLTGRPYHASPIQQDYIRPAGCCLSPCAKCSAESGSWCHDVSGQRVAIHEKRWEQAGPFAHVGWHTFRHTYRSWLDVAGAPVGVQQKLMRHAQVSTTMNVYGNALMDAKREANAKVVTMALRLAPTGPNPDFSNVEKSLKRLVAGAGFEPATFGL